MGRKSTDKGKAGERELANVINDLTGLTLRRKLGASRDGGSDLEGLDGWSIECKRTKVSAIPAWWEQTCEQAAADGDKPVLMYRLDGKRGWRTIFLMADAGVPCAADLWCETTIGTFLDVAGFIQPEEDPNGSN